MKNVFVINGFLEAGKTEFIRFTITQPYFQTTNTTLLILCEEGEVEIEEEILRKTHTVVEVIDNKEDLNSTTLLNLEKKHKPERIILEYNGMWQMSDLKMPWHWKLAQQVTIINAATFNMYFANMRSLISDMVKRSELIIFNRCDGLNKDLPTYKRNVMALNRNAEIVFEDSKGEINTTLDEELPFDVNAPVIELVDETYGIWFFDCLDNPDRYEGKTIKFLANVVKPDNMEKGYLVPGRSAMTCCAEDIAFLGFICKTDESDKYKKGDWITIIAQIKMEFWKDYNGVGPVLYAKEIIPAKAPKEEVINLV
ncbi:MAG: GTPase [Lachnospiraceae bacterium]|nr:GTPase [Lachnospiraceae bacterium]